MNNRLKKTSVWMPLAIAVALVAGMWIGKSFFNNSARWNSRSKLDTILDIIDRSYVDDIDTDSLLETSFAGLLSHLDPHSVYIPASDLQNVNEELSGSFSGVGISFNLLNDSINVLEVISGGPSEKAGLLAGDKIVSINDTIVAGQNWSDVKVRASLRGPKGSVVKLGIKRHTSNKVLTFEVIRGDIPVTSIDASYMIAPKIGYVKINKFGSNTYSEFLTSVINLMADGAEKFVIDLRGNGGGFMELAVLMANEFLPAGSPIVSMRGKTTPDERPTFSDGSGSLLDKELVVLIDEVSASASEIFAGAIQDNDRGLVIGRRSFGKGLVQNQMELPDSSAIRLTIARYYTPSGRCIQKTYAPGTDYDRDIINRYEHGEFYSADSIKLDKSLAFETLHGRTVYGGGGIMPDKFVPIDTTMYSPYYRDLIAKGAVNNFTVNYVDANRAKIKSAYPTEDLYIAKFTVTPEIMQGLIDRGTADGVKYDEEQYRRSEPLLRAIIKGLIGRDIYEQSTYSRVVGPLDPTFATAVEIINDPALYRSYLSAPKK